jgi:hypothetical protein
MDGGVHDLYDVMLGAYVPVMFSSCVRGSWRSCLEKFPASLHYYVTPLQQLLGVLSRHNVAGGKRLCSHGTVGCSAAGCKMGQGKALRH